MGDERERGDDAALASKLTAVNVVTNWPTPKLIAVAPAVKPENDSDAKLHVDL